MAHESRNVPVATPHVASAKTTVLSIGSLSPQGRRHRRSRGCNGPAQKKKNTEEVVNDMCVTELRAATTMKSVAAKVDVASPTVLKTNSLTAPSRQGCPHISGTVEKWRRGVCGETGGSTLLNETPVTAMHVQPLASNIVAPQLPSPPSFPATPLPVWCRSSSAVAYSLSEDGLTNELVDFFHYTELTAQEAAARMRLLRCVEESVEAIWNTDHSSSSSSYATEEVSSTERVKTVQLALYGSYALGLSLPSSDIDLVLTFPAEEKQEIEARRQRAPGREKSGDKKEDAENSSNVMEAAKQRQQLHLERLHDLAEHLRRTHGLSLKVEVYDQCRVPRVHLRDTAAGGVSCDINSSLTSTHVARIVSRQRRWLADSPLAAFLVRVTKAAVRQWDLNEVFTGGLASTALYCLVLRFLAQAEQLHRHAKMEENLSPPRYNEATQSVLSLRTSVCRSPLSPSFPTTSSTPVESPPVANAATVDVRSAPVTVSTVAEATAPSIPTYVPSWLLNSKAKNTASTSAATVSKKTMECVASTASFDTYLLSQWHGKHGNGSSNLALREKGNDDSSDDMEVDSLTQEALTHTSCTSTTPTNRTATNTPSSPPLLPQPIKSEGKSSVPFTTTTINSCSFSVATEEKKVCESAAYAEAMAPATPADSFPSAEELTRMTLARYGASPARLLLKLWRSLSADTFLDGYRVADVFGDDAVWATSELKSFSCKPSALPGTASLELATYASSSSTDLSAPSFRLPDLLALFRCSSALLDNMLRFQRYPRRMAPTMLSTIFVDPRTQFSLP